MSDLNHITMYGRLTCDVKISYTPSQTAVADFSIANNRKYKDGQGNQKEDVCFTEVRVFGKQAETIAKYLGKGDPIIVSGRLDQDRWTTNDGQKRSKHRIIANDFQFLGPKPTQGSQADPPPGQGTSFGGQGSDLPFDDDSEYPF